MSADALGREAAPPPHDMTDAIRHMRHARRINNELADTKRDYQAEIDRLQDAMGERVRILTNELEWHQAPIRSFHEMTMTEDSSQRTLHTPHGRSKISVPDKAQVFIDDPSKLAEWASESMPDVVQRKVLVSDLRKAVTVTDDKVFNRATGEVVPGVHAEVPAPRWSIDLDPGSPM